MSCGALMLNCKRYSFPGLQNDCLHTCSLLGVGFYVIFGPFWGDQCVGQSHPGKSVSNRSGLFQLGAARYLSLRGAGDHWKTVITVLSASHVGQEDYIHITGLPFSPFLWVERIVAGDAAALSAKPWVGQCRTWPWGCFGLVTGGLGASNCWTCR